MGDDAAFGIGDVHPDSELSGTIDQIGQGKRQFGGDERAEGKVVRGVAAIRFGLQTDRDVVFGVHIGEGADDQIDRLIFEAEDVREVVLEQRLGEFLFERDSSMVFQSCRGGERRVGAAKSMAGPLGTMPVALIMRWLPQ